MMKLLLISLSILFVLGCKASNDLQEKNSEEQATINTETTKAPVLIEAQIIGSGEGSKYYWYEIKPLVIIRNSIEANLESSLKVAIQNDKAQLQLTKSYILEVGYYNELHPEYGLKILNFKEK